MTEVKDSEHSEQFDQFKYGDSEIRGAQTMATGNLEVARGVILHTDREVVEGLKWVKNPIHGEVRNHRTVYVDSPEKLQFEFCGTLCLFLLAYMIVRVYFPHFGDSAAPGSSLAGRSTSEEMKGK